MLTKNQQLEKMEYARRLIRGGFSRRRTDIALHAKFREGIGKATYSRLYGERVRQIEERETRPVGYRKPKTKRQDRYNELVKNHFTPLEARELSALRGTKKIHELSVMAKERTRLYNRFLRRAAGRGYSHTEFQKRWVATVLDWYGKNALRWQKQFERWHKDKGHRVVKKRDMISLLWKWFGHTKKELPPDLQYETPRKGRRKQQPVVTVDKVMSSRWINDLQTSIADPNTTPAQRVAFRNQIKILREGL